MLYTRAELRKVPGVAGTNVRFMQCWVASLQATVGPGLRAERAKVQAPKAPATTILRMAVDKRYATEEDWKATVSKPGHMAKTWLRNTVAWETARTVHDLWGWQERANAGGGKPTMTGLMRVDTASIEALLAASGRAGWFIEPLKWLPEYPPTCRTPPPVRWIPREKEEEGLAYLCRVEAMASKLGLARGDRQLGVRTQREE